MTVRDPWALLGVPHTASDEEIKSAYRALAKQYHPDRNGGETAAFFQDLARAYESIKDADARALFQVNNERPSPPPGAPGTVEQVIDINFRQSFEGAQIPVDLEVSDICSACGGSGAAAGEQPQTCASCSGSGEHQTGPMVQKCRDCQGRGFIIRNPCPRCQGGLAREVRQVIVQVPAGIADGHKLNVAGPQTRAGAAELVITVHVAPSPVFQRTFAEPADLLIEVPISYSEACFGASVKIPTPERVIALRIPPATPSGKAFRVSGQGMPYLNKEGRGDLFARVQIVVPDKMGSTEKRLVEQLAQTEKGDLRNHLFLNLGD